MKKTLFILILAFLLFSCDDDGMETNIENPFIGVWMANFADGSDMVVSNIQFLEKDFYYYIIRILPMTGEELSRITYKGKYNYNVNSSIIFFEIEEPESEAGITTSSYQFHEDKLYCYGNKIFITEMLHSKVDISRFINNQ
jgi:hypothetical protein